MHREIIDESDVYIDVHKAIRRTNLAPKTKIGKHGVVAEPEINIAQAEEDLIDLGDDNKPQHKALQRTATGELTANGSASDKPKPKPNLRRTSSIASVTKDGQPKPLSNVDHFRHLGPSNLASRPRQTRYNTVKIKPGGGSLAENVIKANAGNNDGSPLAASIASPAPQGGAGTGLLSSAGKDASDGVLAVQQGYGTTGGTPPKSSSGGGKTGSGGPSAASQAHPSATIPEEEPHRQRSKSRTKEHSDSESTIGSLKWKDVSPRQLKKRGTARSGSITEQIVDLGGVRKVVLETTSSSEENAVNGGNGGDVGNRKENGEGPSEGGVPVDGRDDEDEGEEDGQKGKGEGGGRKKRRRRKRKPAGEGKGGDADEGAPLLGR